MTVIVFMRLTFFLLVLGSSVYYLYIMFDFWGAVGIGFLLWIIWTIYCGWRNKKQRLLVEKYLKIFIFRETSLERYQRMVDIIFDKSDCTGQIAMDDSGVHFRLNSAFYIPWKYVVGITLIDGKNESLARFFFSKEQNSKPAGNLFIIWNDSFNEQIPSSVNVIDSRKKPL